MPGSRPPHPPTPAALRSVRLVGPPRPQLLRSDGTLLPEAHRRPPERGPTPAVHAGLGMRRFGVPQIIRAPRFTPPTNWLPITTGLGGGRGDDKSDRFGEDDRSPVESQKVFQAPYNRICSLSIARPGAPPMVGTGWLLNDRTVVTAGHCLHDPVYGPAASVTAIPARDGDYAPFGWATATRWATAPGWVGTWLPAADFGVAFFDTPFAVGGLAFAPASDARLPLLDLILSGYPSYGTADRQLYAKGRVNSVEADALGYFLDTTEGESGAPLLAPFGNTAFVIGIHTLGGYDENRGVRLTAPVCEILDAWSRV